MKLCDIFDEIDVNGDLDLEWDEFTLFCIQDAVAATRREGAKVPHVQVCACVCVCVVCAATVTNRYGTRCRGVYNVLVSRLKTQLHSAFNAPSFTPTCTASVWRL